MQIKAESGGGNGEITDLGGKRRRRKRRIADLGRERRRRERRECRFRRRAVEAEAERMQI